MKHDVLVEVPIPLVSHDRGALGEVSSQPSRVIEVVVRIDDIAKGLARYESAGFVDDR